MKLRPYLILRDPDPEPKGGGKGNDPPPAEPPADINKRIETLLKAHGDANGAVRALLTERDQAFQQLADVRSKLPKEGHRVIDPDAGRLLDEYAALGHKPADIKAALAERDDLKGKVAKRERDDHHARVAGLHGFKPSVYATLADRDGVEAVVVEEKDPRTQKPVEVAKVKGRDDKGNETLTPLPEYAETHWGDYLPALKPDARPAAPALGSPPAANGAPRPPVVDTSKSGEFRRSFVS